MYSNFQGPFMLSFQNELYVNFLITRNWEMWLPDGNLCCETGIPKLKRNNYFCLIWPFHPFSHKTADSKEQNFNLESRMSIIHTHARDEVSACVILLGNAVQTRVLFLRLIRQCEQHEEKRQSIWNAIEPLYHHYQQLDYYYHSSWLDSVAI